MRSPGHETCHHRIYFLTCDAYEALLARAGGRCEICRVPAAEVYRGKLLIDHDMRIGWRAVRGLVCPKCNAHLRRVDSGERPVDERVAAYFALPKPNGGEAAIPESAVRAFVAWYRRVPGARLPERPEASSANRVGFP